MTAPAIEISGLSKSFDGGRSHAVEAVDLTIAAGAFVALVGGSGSGKTTTLKTINGLVRPDAGQVRIDGEPIGEAAAHRLRRRIGYVFQEVGLFPHLTVAENIGITPRLLGWPKARIAARVESCWTWSACRAPSPAARRRSCPAASASGSALPARWRRPADHADGRAVRRA